MTNPTDTLALALVGLSSASQTSTLSPTEASAAILTEVASLRAEVKRLTVERDAIAADRDHQAGLARTRLSVGVACERACGSLRTRAETAERERDEARREAVEIAALAQDGDDELANLRRVAADYGWSYLYTKDADDA